MITQSGKIAINYHLLDIGLNCFKLRWNYEGQNCQPSTFTLQGFELAQVDSDPSVIISTSSTGSFSLITSQIFRLNATLFKVSASDRTGMVCNSETHFYNFTLSLRNGVSEKIIVIHNFYIHRHRDKQALFEWFQSCMHLMGRCKCWRQCFSSMA